MKTCDEMLESVLCRAKTDIAKRKQRRKTALTIGATGLCLALILGLTLVPWSPVQPPLPTEGLIAAPPTQASEPTLVTDPTQPQTDEPTQPTESDPPTKAKLYLLSYNDTQAFQNILPADVSIPVGGQVWVRSFYGLSEEEREQAKREFDAMVEAYRKEDVYLGGIGGGGSRSETRDYIVQMVIKGGLSLEFENEDQVLSVEGKTTNGGSLGGGKMIYTQTTTYGTGEHQVTYPEGTTLYGFFWNISYEMKLALLRNPNTPFSSIKDTIVITVNYANGATEVLKVDVTLNDEGEIFMTLRGNNL